MQDTRRKYTIKVLDSTYADTWDGNEKRYLRSLYYGPHVTANIINRDAEGWDAEVVITIMSHPETLKQDVNNELQRLGRGTATFNVYDDQGERMLTEEDFE